MNNLRLWVWIQGLAKVVTTVAIVLGSTVATATDTPSTDVLPSSLLPAKQEWKKMHPTSFPATEDSAYKQCLRTAALSERDGLDVKKCNLLRDKLTHPESYSVEEQCRSVMVPDGIVFNFMNGLIAGHEGVTELVKKQLGREDKALLCPLGDGLYAYWFRDDPGRSCNNVGFAYVPPPPKPPEPPSGRLVCWDVPLGDNAIRSDTIQFLGGVYLPGCCNDCDNCCDTDFYVSGHSFYIQDDIRGHGSVQECIWVNDD